MHTTDGLEPISPDTLASIHGGKDKPWGNDIAHQIKQGAIETFNSWRFRTGQAATDLATRNIPGAIGNSLAATSDYAFAAEKIAAHALPVAKP